MVMGDALKERLDSIRAHSNSVNRRISLLSDISKIDHKNTTRSLGSLQKAPSPGKKLQKIGFIMLWVPEPTGITCAIGGPMILAGKFLNKKYNAATLADIGEHARDTSSSINDFKRSIL